MNRRGLRLSGGTLGGRRIVASPGTRPTQERIREALFSRWGPRIVGARFLDLFCGGGAVGLEALSRGAGEVVLVDRPGRALASARANLESLSIDDRARIVGLDLPAGWRRQPAALQRPFDLVFLDPPYDFADLEEIVALAGGALEARGEMAVEHAGRRRVEPVGGLEVVDRRGYGDAAVTYLRPG